MKSLIIALISLLSISLSAETLKELKVDTKVNEVTVFIEGAQISRHKTVDVPAGKSILKFEGLSPFIDAKSVQARIDGYVTVLSVNHQKNFVKKANKSEEINKLIAQFDAIDDELVIEYAYLSIIKEELAFLNENRNLGGRNEQVTVLNLQQASEYYGKRLKELKLASIDRNKTISDLEDQQEDLQNQINSISSVKETPTGEIIVKVEAKDATKAKVEISYVVSNAGWFPSYDIRAQSINEPIELIYKANVRQDTKEDWDNVTLSFSSSNPNVSGVAPALQTYFLNYYLAPPRYNSKMSNNIQGKIFDEDGEALIGVVIKVEGTTIGAISGMDGSFSITIPNQNSMLSFSYIGMKTQVIRPKNNYMMVSMENDFQSLDEVVVIGYGSKKSITGAISGKMPGLHSKNESIKVRGMSSQTVAMDKVENQTSVEFKIEKPYTLKSNNKNLAVDMVVYEIPADYQYYCVPKVDKDAFLIAYITDWEKYNLLEGEANIFFENTYIGKTLLDVSYAQDTLELSLGRDKSVTIQREKKTDYKTKRFVGSKREDVRAWNILVKNNKSQDINMVILDQVPVSTIDEIEVEVLEKSGAQMDVESGEIKWEFDLESSAKKELELKYSVKYPKSKNLTIE